MQTPFVSCLVISYNQKAFIARCIDSILKQQHPYTFEIVVADDCSTDGTIEYLKKEYADKNIIYLDESKNLGISKNYQRSFAACRGKYIAVLEADDYWCYSKRIARMVDFLERNKEYAYAANRFLAVSENGSFYNPAPKQESPICLTADDIVYCEATELMNMVGNFSTCVYRAAVVPKLSPTLFEQGFYDWGINLGFAQHGPCAYFKELMSVYTIRSDSTWNRLSSFQKRLDFFKGLNALYKFFPKQRKVVRKAQYLWLKNLLDRRHALTKFKHLIKESLRVVCPSFFGEKLRYIRNHYRSDRTSRKEQASYYCSMCNRPVQEFWELGEELMLLYRKHNCLGGRFESELFSPTKFSCPHCGGMDRERLVAEYFLQHFKETKPNPDFRLLEFAPRDAMRRFFENNFSIQHETADLLMPGVDHIVDICTMTQFADASYDAWICLHVLEHVVDDAAALRELYRILKPGGFGVLLVPISLTLEQTEENPDAPEEERWKRFGQGDHIRLYAKNDFVPRIRSAGFIVREYGIEFFGRHCLEKLGLPETSTLYVVERQAI